MTFVKALLRPPMRLRALPDRLAKLLRALWILLFGLSVLTVVVSTIYAVRASYWIQPTIYQFNLDFDVTTEGKLVVGTLPGRQPAVPVTAKVIAIDGKPVPPDLQVAGARRTPRQRAGANRHGHRPRSRRPNACADAGPQQDRRLAGRDPGAQPADLGAASDGLAGLHGAACLQPAPRPQEAQRSGRHAAGVRLRGHGRDDRPAVAVLALDRSGHRPRSARRSLLLRPADRHRRLP